MNYYYNQPRENQSTFCILCRELDTLVLVWRSSSNLRSLSSLSLVMATLEALMPTLTVDPFTFSLVHGAVKKSNLQFHHSHQAAPLPAPSCLLFSMPYYTVSSPLIQAPPQDGHLVPSTTNTCPVHDVTTCSPLPRTEPRHTRSHCFSAAASNDAVVFRTSACPEALPSTSPHHFSLSDQSLSP
ncbi:hypothetical protein M0R45_009004 [Rubus argutus]|uniref:Uncharacterized protein n=1 Tax=Rubus argutus TaxID=59490 RepID=A0AAW1Y5B4_RUBAR